MPTTDDRIQGWFTGRVPGGWFVEPVDVEDDRDEIFVCGRVAEPSLAGDASDDARAEAHAGAIRAHREDTRDQRIRIAQEAEVRFGRKIAWGARCGDRTEVFTTLNVPVMTRLRMPERKVLDTLIDAGIARSRSEALAWCVRLVGRHQSDWIEQLRDAVAHVARVRDEGPEVA
jgi:hypothetical protein